MAGKQFFPMSLGDKLFIGVLLVFSFVSFLPWSRSISWAGMAMQGWMMALLMVLSPAIAIGRLFAGSGEQEDVGT